MSDDFTLAEWMMADKEPFGIDETVLEQLSELSNKMMDLAEAHGVPLIVCFIEGSDLETSSFVGSSNFNPHHRVPAEMLAAYSMLTEGFLDGYEIATKILMEMK